MFAGLALGAVGDDGPELAEGPLHGLDLLENVLPGATWGL